MAAKAARYSSRYPGSTVYENMVPATAQSTTAAAATRARGGQVIATKNMRLFCHENGLKPHISV